MDVKSKKKADSLTVYIYGEIDEYSACKLKTEIGRIIDNNLTSSSVTFDLSGVTFMDSTGIGMLIGRYKFLRDFDIRTYISGAGANVEKIIELSGLYRIMPRK